MTPSTIWRSISGTTVWQTLPSTAATMARLMSRRWRSMSAHSRRTHPGGGDRMGLGALNFVAVKAVTPTGAPAES